MPHHVMTAPFPIPRSFVMEDLIAFHSTSAGGDEKEREKEREEGKEEAHAANNEMRFREEQNSRPLHCPLTAQVALPEDPLVARAFFPHSLFNYTVGWVKLPSGPVRNKRRPSAAFLIPDDDEEDDAPVAHIGMQGIVAAASAGPVTATTTTTMADPALEPKGFLCASKPVYDVTVDGPVTAPYDPRVEEAKYKQPIGAPCVVASLRHLEKYYLYVKRLTHICLTLSWKDPLDNEAPFVDVDRSYGISYLHGPAGGPKLQSRLTSARGPRVGAARPTQGFFFRFPVLHDGGLSSFHPAILASEVSLALPLLPSLCDSGQWYTALRELVRLEDRSSQVHPNEVVDADVDAERIQQMEQHVAAVTQYVSMLSDEQIAWLCFRLRLLEWIRSTTQILAAKRERREQAGGKRQTPPHGGELGSDPSLGVPATQLSVKVGVRVQYDNQQFYAYNSYGTKNHVMGHYSLPRTPSVAMSPFSVLSASEWVAEDKQAQEPYLVFVDTTRTPAIETSNVLSQSEPLLVQCRSERDERISTSSVWDSELRLLQLLFDKFLNTRVAML